MYFHAPLLTSPRVELPIDACPWTARTITCPGWFVSMALPGPTWAKSKKIAAVLTAVIPLDGRSSLYVLWGDWLPWSCWLVLAAWLCCSFVWPRRATGPVLG